MRRIGAGMVLAAALATAATAQEEVQQGTGAVLRALDKVNASVMDIPLENGGMAEYGPLTVRMDECRYPAGDPAGDAFAFLTIHDAGTGDRLFSGWMLASSPALNALEHPRYDIWVLRCKTD